MSIYTFVCMDDKQSQFVPALAFKRLTVYYDTLAHSFLPENKFKSALIEQMGIMPLQHILDFGVGTATLTILAKQKHIQAEFAGIDIDPVIAEIANKKIKKAGLSIPVKLYDGATLPYPDESFDKVMSSLTFHHLTTGQKISSLKEILRVLNPGGEIHIADWGKAENMLMRFLFYFVQFFDGFSRTEDNVKGLLPVFMERAGFTNVRETSRFSTMVGTLSIYKGKKS